MNNQWIIIETAWVWPLVIASVFLTLLIIREVAGDGRRKGLAILCYSIATMALLLIALKPEYKRPVSSSTFILLTEGYDQQQLDSLRKATQGELVMHYDSASYHQLKRLLETRSAYILGTGFDPDELSLWKDGNIVYHEGAQPEGVTRLNFKPKHRVGEKVIIQGAVNRPDAVQLKLEALGATLDSTQVAAGEQSFSLQTDLKVPGRFTIKVIEENVDGTVLKASELPIIVEEPERLKVLLINTFPTFELKYLKNFLVQEGHELTVRNQLSKNKYRYEYYNTDRQRFNRLNESLLKDFDLVLTNNSTLNQLSYTGKQSLKQQIEEGLGLFVIPDESMFNGNDFVNFKFEPAAETTQLEIDGEVLEVKKHPFSLAKQFGEAHVYEGVSGYQRFGAGRIGITTLLNTYQLVLNGEADVYQKLWKRHLESVAQKENGISLSADWLAQVNHPYHFTIKGLQSKPAITVEAVDIALQQDPHLPENWQSSYWPEKEGWHAINIENSQDSLWFYAQNSNNWMALNNVKRQKANSRVFNNALKDDGQKIAGYALINPIWFYLAFLISVGYLWLAPKLTSQQKK